MSKFYELSEEEREKGLLKFKQTKNKSGLSYGFICELLYILRTTNNSRTEETYLDLINKNCESHEPMVLKNNRVSNIISHNIDNIITNNGIESTNAINIPNSLLNRNTNNNIICEKKLKLILYT